MVYSEHAKAFPESKFSRAGGSILQGVRVLDLTRYLSGPQATLFLADLGAEVVRIDDPSKGDPAASAPPFFGPHGASLERRTAEDLGIAYLKRGRGKKSVAIDLKSAAGRDLFLRLVKKADVVVENFRVGVTERLGIDYDALRQHNPDLIYCSITGFGSDGPESDRKAYDLMVQAASGLMSVTGQPDGNAYKTGSPISDGLAGTFAVLGILGALFHRMRTGEGQFIDVSMTDCLVSLMYDEPWDCYETLGLPFRQGNRIMRFSPFNTYHAADGIVAVGAATDADWINLLEVMGREDLKNEPTYMDRGWRISNNAVVDDVVSAWAKTMPLAEIAELCTSRSIPCSPIRAVDDLRNWDQMRHRQLLTTASHPLFPDLPGPVAARFPLKFSAVETESESSAATLGEHHYSVLEEWLGESEETPHDGRNTE
jgi:CoA:oxalate CoA-transferase